MSIIKKRAQRNEDYKKSNRSSKISPRRPTYILISYQLIKNDPPKMIHSVVEL